LARTGAELEEGEAAVHRQHHDRAEQDEQRVAAAAGFVHVVSSLSLFDRRGRAAGAYVGSGRGRPLPSMAT
jgi:hypothetical protein